MIHCRHLFEEVSTGARLLEKMFLSRLRQQQRNSQVYEILTKAIQHPLLYKVEIYSIPLFCDEVLIVTDLQKQHFMSEHFENKTLN